MISAPDKTRQELFFCTTPEGARLTLAVLLDGSYAILRNGEIMSVTKGAAEPSAELINQFLSLCARPSVALTSDL